MILLTASGLSKAQFIDNFNKAELHEDWFFFPGDGTPTMDFIQKDGYATVFVDGSTDKHNVYWTILKRDIAEYVDLKKLKDPDYELRVEAKVRIHNPPHRVNFMVNTQRTTVYHHDLLEFDLPDTNWHVISMVTNNLDAVPGDSLYVQFSVTDFGLRQYEVDLDYFKADIINIKKDWPTSPLAVPYHPPIPELSTFTHQLEVTRDALINSYFPEVNFNDWHVREKDNEARILTINENQWAVLRWDLEAYKNSKADGAGVFEFTTYSVPYGGNYMEAYEKGYGEEFPRVRVIEILGGDADWDQETVTYDKLIEGKDYEEVFNTQMIYDTQMEEVHGSKNLITISQPVLQRLLDGTTKGLLIRPLGAIDPSFYASEDKNGDGPKLYFNVVE